MIVAHLASIIRATALITSHWGTGGILGDARRFAIGRAHSGSHIGQINRMSHRIGACGLATSRGSTDCSIRLLSARACGLSRANLLHQIV